MTGKQEGRNRQLQVEQGLSEPETTHDVGKELEMTVKHPCKHSVLDLTPSDFSQQES